MQPRFVIERSVQKKSSPEIRGKTYQKNPSLIAQAIRQATQQASLRCQRPHQGCQRELPLQQGSLLRSWQEAGSWEPELSQARQFQFFARTPREARHQPVCRCISS